MYDDLFQESRKGRAMLCENSQGGAKNTGLYSVIIISSSSVFEAFPFQAVFQRIRLPMLTLDKWSVTMCGLGPYLS